MPMAVGTNAAALNAANAASSANREMEAASARLTTGKRINVARDDAAGVAISSRLTTEIRGISQAIRNAQDSRALLYSVESVHAGIEKTLQRMREISLQAINDTNNNTDRLNLQHELHHLGIQIDSASVLPSWSGGTTFPNGSGSFNFHLGSSSSSQEFFVLNISSMKAVDLGVAVAPIIPVDPPAIDTTTEVTEPVAASNYPGSNNTDDVLLDNYNENYTNALDTINFTADTETPSIVEIKGVQYVFNGTAEQNASALFDALSADQPGVPIESLNLGTLSFVNSANIFSDYEAAFEIDDMIFVGDPLSGGNDTNFMNVGQPVEKDTSYSHQGGFAVSPRANEISIMIGTAALEAVAAIDAAMSRVNDQRSKLGAISNRLNHTVNNLTNISSNLSAAKGGIEDADFALETTKLAKNQILLQASTAMLAQANASKQNVVSLLQG